MPGGRAPGFKLEDSPAYQEYSQGVGPERKRHPRARPFTVDEDGKIIVPAGETACRVEQDDGNLCEAFPNHSSNPSNFKKHLKTHSDVEFDTTMGAGTKVGVVKARAFYAQLLAYYKEETTEYPDEPKRVRAPAKVKKGKSVDVISDDEETAAERGPNMEAILEHEEDLLPRLAKPSGNIFWNQTAMRKAAGVGRGCVHCRNPKRACPGPEFDPECDVWVFYWEKTL